MSTEIPLPPPQLKPWAIGILHDRVVIAASKDEAPLAAFDPPTAMMLAAQLVGKAMQIAAHKAGLVVDAAVDKAYGKGDPAKQ